MLRNPELIGDVVVGQPFRNCIEYFDLAICKDTGRRGTGRFTQLELTDDVTRNGRRYRRASIDKIADRAREVFGQRVFQEIAAGARAYGLHNGRIIAKGGDDHDFRAGKYVPRFSDQTYAIAIGELQVCEHDVWLESFQRGKTLRQGSNGGDTCKVRFFLQPLQQEIYYIFLIFNQKYLNLFQVARSVVNKSLISSLLLFMALLIP